MSDMVELDQRFHRGPEIARLLVPDLDDPLVGREKLALFGRGLEVDQVLDRQAHPLVSLQQRARVSEVKDSDLAGARSQGER